MKVHLNLETPNTLYLMKRIGGRDEKNTFRNDGFLDAAICP